MRLNDSGKSERGVENIRLRWGWSDSEKAHGGVKVDDSEPRRHLGVYPALNIVHIVGDCFCLSIFLSLCICFRVTFNLFFNTQPCDLCAGAEEKAMAYNI